MSSTIACASLHIFAVILLETTISDAIRTTESDEMGFELSTVSAAHPFGTLTEEQSEFAKALFAVMDKDRDSKLFHNDLLVFPRAKRAKKIVKIATKKQSGQYYADLDDWVAYVEKITPADLIRYASNLVPLNGPQVPEWLIRMKPEAMEQAEKESGKVKKKRKGRKKIKPTQEEIRHRKHQKSQQKKQLALEEAREKFHIGEDGYWITARVENGEDLFARIWGYDAYCELENVPKDTCQKWVVKYKLKNSVQWKWDYDFQYNRGNPYLLDCKKFSCKVFTCDGSQDEGGDDKIRECKMGSIGRCNYQKVTDTLMEEYVIDHPAIDYEIKAAEKKLFYTKCKLKEDFRKKSECLRQKASYCYVKAA